MIPEDGLFYPFTFEAPMERHGVGRTRKIWYTVVFLPAEIAMRLPFERHPQLRVEGEIADVPIKGAFIPAGDGRWYIIVSPATLKSADLRLGQIVEMRFRVSDQDSVDVPDVLDRALSRDGQARDAWVRLTTGRRRGLAYYVATAKTDPTQHRRVAAVLAAITGDAPTTAIAEDARRLHRLLGKK
jgi:hypothetical protein